MRKALRQDHNFTFQRRHRYLILVNALFDVIETLNALIYTVISVLNVRIPNQGWKNIIIKFVFKRNSSEIG